MGNVSAVNARTASCSILLDVDCGSRWCKSTCPSGCTGGDKLQVCTGGEKKKQTCRTTTASAINGCCGGYAKKLSDQLATMQSMLDSFKDMAHPLMSEKRYSVHVWV